MGWFGVRCVFRWSGEASYEERVTIWQAASMDEAIELAEVEALCYAQEHAFEYLNFAQAYTMVDEPEHGREIFSLLRDSALSVDEYLDTFFDTGGEHEGHVS